MSKLTEIYERLARKTSCCSMPDRETLLNAIEEEHPELKLFSLTEEHRTFLFCLEKALQNFNGKWKPGDEAHSNLSWVYFTPENHTAINVQEVYDYFKNLCEEDLKRKKEELLKTINL